MLRNAIGRILSRRHAEELARITPMNAKSRLDSGRILVSIASNHPVWNGCSRFTLAWDSRDSRATELACDEQVPPNSRGARSPLTGFAACRYPEANGNAGLLRVRVRETAAGTRPPTR